MFVSDCLRVNERGNLTIGNTDTIQLVQQYGTPLYVMDETLIRENCRKFKQSMDKCYDGKGLVAYASKAFACKEIYRIVAEEGLGIDVVSGGELYTAVSAGFPAEKIFFHGNNKTTEEMLMGLQYKVGRIVVDNLTELEILNSLAKSVGQKANIMFRIKPGIDAHTHNFIKTGQIDSKFGLALENGEALDAVKKAIVMEHVNLIGLHCHIGSQIFDIDPFEHAGEVMMNFIGEIKAKTGCEIKELNLGGGFGIKYIPEHDPVTYDKYMERVSKAVKAAARKNNVSQPFVAIEPGRSIVGSAGITLYTVGSVKEIPGVRTYVAVDGGMADNPRYILYKSEYDIMVANKASQAKTMTATIAGRCCESGDLIGEDVQLQAVVPGDIIAVLATGAYNYSMSSNYNRLPKPPVVMVKNGESRVIVKRQTYENLVENDI